MKAYYVMLDIFLLLNGWHWKGSVLWTVVYNCYKAEFSGQVLHLITHLQSSLRIEPGFIYFPL